MKAAEDQSLRRAVKPLEHEELTERIIGAAIEVHRRPGPGFIESIYEKPW